MTALKIISIFLVALVVFLAMSIGVALGLAWIFPTISFEMGVLIGTVSLSIVFYAFIKIISLFPILDSLPIDIDDNQDLDQITPPRSTRSNRRKRR